MKYACFKDIYADVLIANCFWRVNEDHSVHKIFPTLLLLFYPKLFIILIANILQYVAALHVRNAHQYLRERGISAHRIKWGLLKRAKREEKREEVIDIESSSSLFLPPLSAPPSLSAVSPSPPSSGAVATSRQRLSCCSSLNFLF